MGKASRKKQLQRETKQPSHEIKLSYAILEICEPFLPEQELKKNELEKLIIIAIVAWNIANLPQKEQPAELMKFIESVSDMREELEADLSKMAELGDILPEDDLSIGSITLQVLSSMINRKRDLYLNDTREIVDFFVEESRNGYKVKISSVLD
jgi:hypothetical protein